MMSISIKFLSLILQIGMIMSYKNKLLNKLHSINNICKLTSNNTLIEDKPIYLHTWLKYFTYAKNINSTNSVNILNSTYLSDNYSFTNNNTISRMNLFFNNTVFDKVKISDKHDNIGLLNIPSINHFFFILTKKNINILTSRSPITARTVDLINISDISNAQDSGNYLEGYCIDINTLNNKIFSLCYDSCYDKLQWITKINQLVDYHNSKTKENYEIETIINQARSMALTALESEVKKESIIEEEINKEERKSQEILESELESVKKQHEFVQQQLDQKRKDAEQFNKKLNLKKKVEEIKLQLQDQIIKARESLKKRLFIRKKEEKRKKELFQQQISDLRKDISTKLLKASKAGDVSLCNPERSTKEIVNYCRKTYNDSNSKQEECIKVESYCFYCCESEFGEIHYDQRAVCVDKCDDFYNKNIPFESGTKNENTFLDELSKNMTESNSTITNTNSTNITIESLVNQTERIELLKSIKDSLNNL